MYYVETADSIVELLSAKVTFFGDRGYGFFKAVVDGAERDVFFHLYHCDSFRQGLFFPRIEDIHHPSGRWSPDEPKKGDIILFLGTINSEHRPGKGEVFNVRRWWKSSDYKKIADSGGKLQDGYEYAVMKYVTVLGPKKQKTEDAHIFQGTLDQLCVDFPLRFPNDSLAGYRFRPLETTIETRYVFLRWKESRGEWEEIPDPRKPIGSCEIAKIEAYREMKDGTTSVVPGPYITLENLRSISVAMACERM